MKEYLRAPFVVPGLILTVAGILASLLIRFIDSNLLSMLASIGCALLCFFGISPTLNYINTHRKQ